VSHRPGLTAAAFLAAAALALGGCGTGSTATQVLAAIGGPQIVAADLKFDRATLEVRAGVAFGLELVNRDGAPHNVAIYRDANANDKLFGGEVINGPASRVYSVPALPPGIWYFRCDVHHDMHGQVISAEPTASPGPTQ
jgi:plastocyanin